MAISPKDVESIPLANKEAIRVADIWEKAIDAFLKKGLARRTRSGGLTFTYRAVREATKRNGTLLGPKRAVMRVLAYRYRKAGWLTTDFWGSSVTLEGGNQSEEKK